MVGIPISLLKKPDFFLTRIKLGFCHRVEELFYLAYLYYIDIQMLECLSIIPHFSFVLIIAKPRPSCKVGVSAFLLRVFARHLAYLL